PDAAPAAETPEHARARAIAETAEWAELYLQPEEVDRLALTREALREHPPAAPADQDAAEPVVAAGRADAEKCLPVLVSESGGLILKQEHAAIVVGPDGGVVETRTSIDTAKDAEAHRCLTAVIGGWRFRPVAGGGLLIVKFTGTGPRRPLRREPRPAAPKLDGKWEKPRTKQNGCVQFAVRIPEAFQSAVSGGPVSVKFLIGADGTPSRFQMVSNVPLPVARELRRAVYSCEWVAGRDAAGVPAPIWVLLPMRFWKH
ncbi:MAG TPA: hypothetical protein VD838_10760, partial [Anaeromyxobacteraceae bacterium]|nr:hypothetical protein [Anaeromyxobacteraceae bacterium]